MFFSVQITICNKPSKCPSEVFQFLPTNVSGYVCDNDGVSRLDMRGQVPSHAEIRFVRVGTLHIEKIKIE